MREIRPSGSEGGARFIPRPYPYQRHLFRLIQRQWRGASSKRLENSTRKASPVVLRRMGYSVWNTAHAPMVSLAEKPLTGEPDAGNPPVRFGGRGGANQCAASTPIVNQRRVNTELRNGS